MEDVYRRLCHRLDEHPVGAPESENFLEILRILFTPEEAELAIHLKLEHEPASSIAAALGREETEIQSLLDEMARKGVCFKDPINQLFGSFPTAPGLWEACFASGEKSPRTERLGHLWREYYKEGWWKELHCSKTPLTRIFPVDQAFDEEAQREVLPYEKSVDLLKSADYIAVLHCACRMAAAGSGHDCGHPTETCLQLGEFGRYMAEVLGAARKVTYEEALDILKMTDEAGLVHLTMNTKEVGNNTIGICSCCECCCTQLRAMTEMKKPRAIACSRFEPIWDEAKCTLCETCVDRCLLDAIAVTDDVVEFQKDKCIGCGLCVTGCPEEALTLEPRTEYEEPFNEIGDLFETFLREKAERSRDEQ